MLAKIFQAAGARGFVHARALQDDRETGLDADELVVTASVFKIPVALEVFTRLDPAERVVVGASDRVAGPTGLSVFRDPVELSVRDLAICMITVSDNTATDVLMRMVGLDAINDTLRSLGLERTVLVGNCRHILATVDRNAVSAMPADGTSRTTPREITRLLELIWRDEAGPPAACAEVRRVMGLQIWPHRLTAGFPEGVRLSAKTGTLPGIRNEAGVVEYPDGARYAVGVFTRAHTLEGRRPEIDRGIGDAARAAVESLRA